MGITRVIMWPIDVIWILTPAMSILTKSPPLTLCWGSLACVREYTLVSPCGVSVMKILVV